MRGAQNLPVEQYTLPLREVVRPWGATHNSSRATTKRRHYAGKGGEGMHKLVPPATALATIGALGALHGEVPVHEQR
jgi:hypothetical protein